VASASSRPRFTVVGAVYDVAAYLPDFIASLEAQDFDLSRVEVLMVDDGSTDDSRAVLDAWAARRPELVRVLGQQNAGQGAARNAGLEAARGEWVTFPDPDDVVDPDYLSTVDAFLTEHPDTVMVATHRVIWDEATGALTNTHPLRRMFGHDRLVDLDLAESLFHGSAPAAFFDLDVLRQHELRFDTRIRPNFEDGHFCASYLLHCARPLVGFLGSTRYHYRKRADSSSSLQGSMRDPRRYTDVFEFGYLAIVDEATRLRGGVPAWLQHFLCYELLGYLVAHDVGRVPVIDPGPETESFHASVRQVLAAVDLDRVLPRMEFGSRPEHRVALAHGYVGQSWRDDVALVETYDADQQLARVRYWFTDDEPDEQVHNGDAPAEPRHAKTRDLSWFGRVLVRERILWVRYAPDLRLSIDGRWADLVFERPATLRTRATTREVRRLTGSPSRHERQLVARAQPTPSSELGRRAAKRAGRPATARKYADAWVLMDRVDAAGDNGEAMFHWLRVEHPEVNACFVLSEDSPDWARLRRLHGKRVVAHGSLEWRVLMAHCIHLLSSYADDAIVRPPEITEFTTPQWRFTFLQHGVIAEDLSGWLGDRPIDLFVTSTPGEQASIAGDGTAYPFTTKEVQLTGLPCFDSLLDVGRAISPKARDLVLVAPTWRRWLGPEALTSDFVRQWTAVLSSADLAEACRTHGLTLVFQPHPQVAALAARMTLPDHVHVETGRVPSPDSIARARVVVTDYSSIAFDAAYVERPVVYFQFDRDLALTGAHLGRPGWFDHRRDGFGPVTTTADDAVAAINDTLAKDPPLGTPYAERMAAAFPARDGQSCRRVFEAVMDLKAPR
jgi:glycosyltransferase involved in cell wall biosynthesis